MCTAAFVLALALASVDIIREAVRLRCVRILYLRYLPHKTASGNGWCLPIPVAWLIGGWYDSGNGYGWTPSLPASVRKFYKEKWYSHNYTLFSWLFRNGPRMRSR